MAPNPNESENVLVLRQLTKHFPGKPKPTVDRLDLVVPKGAIYGFLGRNGAGKSTTIRMLLGLVEPTRGSAEILGHPCDALTPEVRARIGYLPEGHHVYGWMTVAECGKFQSAFFPQWNWKIFNAVVDHFRLTPKMASGSLSRGQRAGLCLAMTLAPEPELLILDDPALGLDPVARRSLLESMLYVTRRSDRTILFSSHLLSDVERVADRIVILDEGTLRANCTVETFRERIRQYALRFPEGIAAPANLAHPTLLQSFRTERNLVLTLANAGEAERQWLATLGAERIEERPLGMEEAFIAYVGDRGEKTFFLDGISGIEGLSPSIA
ncbi:ABC-2 type transport system ATP-binding protein [Verrucomicrobium sp. GAS474]|uniref:ABC transporter ATP-binding protein n=1 Tax=Verrucomicrobium sp. GAS474 TaxID=1882831 RepID=UPI00087D8977|nr:ABC transporter ATP-binding protein [Verrucomicrobium sp. GAS474]SDT92207.1 ABC-2 type transport system ATP-binding protein [Verrucomicrobium sp. GAS474]